MPLAVVGTLEVVEFYTGTANCKTNAIAVVCTVKD